MRIDDLDTPRNLPGAANGILNTLNRYGLNWDGEVYYQSQHQEDYQAAIAQLKADQRVYRCYCSRAQLADTGKLYPGHCRKAPQTDAGAHALRLITPDSPIDFVDRLQGNVSQNLAKDHGDFIIKRKDAIIAYQLAVVIDDKLQQVNHIVRGYDLLDSTPKQLYLQQCLGYSSPCYLHVPVIVDQNGHKLSKQTRAAAVNMQNPEKTLYRLLGLLSQNPPIELKQASIQEQLNWGIANWQPQQLRRSSTAPHTIMDDC